MKLPFKLVVNGELNYPLREPPHADDTHIALAEQRVQDILLALFKGSSVQINAVDFQQLPFETRK